MIYRINFFENDLFLLLNKNQISTSSKFIQKIKRYALCLRIGHSGTLDPSAFGLLIVCIGKKTRYLNFLCVKKKRYLAFVIIGVNSDTYDILGKINFFCEKSVYLDKKKTKISLKILNNIFLQSIPKYSSVKHNAIRLYKYSRLEINFRSKKKNIKIHKINIVKIFKNILVFDVVCSKGTYVREIANIIGKNIYLPICILKIVRLKIGKYSILDSFFI